MDEVVCGRGPQEVVEGEPVVSVVVPVYNHERYIERCLRAIAAQKVDFPYEVLIGEDCSPDGSREVLRRLEDEMPRCFKFIYREHNMGDMGSGNSSDLFNQGRGRYLSICEGDDFWTYDGKLQAQVDFLESHPDYVACYHHCTVVGDDSEPNGEKYPDCLREEYGLSEFFYCTLPGQSATILARAVPYAEAKREFNAHRMFKAYPADRRNAFTLLSRGRVHVFQEPWSAYRHVVKGGASYSARVKINEEYAANDVNFGRTLVAFADSTGKPELMRAARETYYRLLLKWSVGRVRCASLGESLRELMGEKGWLHYLLGVPRWYVVLAFRALRGQGVTM